jgi:hypothetical protein
VAKVVLSSRNAEIPQAVENALLKWLDAWEEWAWCTRETTRPSKTLALGSQPKDIAMLLRFTAFLTVGWVEERNPTLVEERNPTLVEERNPTLVEERNPTLVEERNPTLVEERNPTLVEERNPWGLLRLKGEDAALVNQAQKQKVVRCFFKTLSQLVFTNERTNQFEGSAGLERLTRMSASEYLGLTGVALQVAREFSFWAESLYAKQKTNHI